MEEPPCYSFLSWHHIEKEGRPIGSGLEFSLWEGFAFVSFHFVTGSIFKGTCNSDFLLLPASVYVCCIS
jgi:hypothetical protein